MCEAYWSGLPFPSPGDLPNPGTEPGSPVLQADSLWRATREALWVHNNSASFHPMNTLPALAPSSRNTTITALHKCAFAAVGITTPHTVPPDGK